MSESSTARPGPRGSWYVTEDFYDAVADDVARWYEPGPPVDTATRTAVEALLAAEARLLDDGRWEEWLDLYTAECLYWVPATPGGGDPRRQVCLAFDDRRRLEDRIAWLRTGTAYSQVPPSRTLHVLGRPEVWATDDGDVRARTPATLHEYRRETLRTFPVWYGHVLRRAGTGGWAIARKQVNVLHADADHRNLTFLF
jgi:3-phenylpropionate/cinnamic acid dioxygenase small subunit